MGSPIITTRQMLKHHGASLMYDEGKDFMAIKCEVDRVSYSKIQIVVISDFYFFLICS